MFAIWVLPYTAGGVYDFLTGQEFLSNTYPALSNIIPSWVPWIWLVLGVIAFMVVIFEGAYRIVSKQRTEIADIRAENLATIATINAQSHAEIAAIKSELEDIRTPKLEIIFGEGEPFHQKQRFVQPDTITSSKVYEQVLFRVGVKNTSSTPIDRVSVRLEAIKPSLLSVHLPTILHKKGDNPLQGQSYASTFPLDPNCTEYVDVVQKTNRVGGVPSKVIELWHIELGMNREIPVGNYEFTLLAYGNAPPLPPMSFTVKVDIKGELSFSPTSSS